jgi:hypothetical protein
VWITKSFRTAHCGRFPHLRERWRKMLLLTPEVKEAIRAHNNRASEPCYNEHWNTANHTGTMRARYLVTCALTRKHGICCGSMKVRKATSALVVDYLVGNSKDREWAFTRVEVA